MFGPRPVGMRSCEAAEILNGLICSAITSHLGGGVVGTTLNVVVVSWPGTDWLVALEIVALVRHFPLQRNFLGGLGK